ncbi:uncharacterized protein LOC126816724 [Patella vulgata]|uniref:uncharacterized protein LOC126816724 n=1 Tax=Patella vulgata TaxID=6465 RepID=UPI00217F9279|nr:uncharacterized protein LOC126816724 [Patella vulgata]
MDFTDDNSRIMYLPLEDLNSGLLSKLGNVRLLMVPKDDRTAYSSLLGEDSDWMMTEKNEPRSPPHIQWHHPAFDFKQRSNDETAKYRQEFKYSQRGSEITEIQMPQQSPSFRTPSDNIYDHIHHNIESPNILPDTVSHGVKHQADKIKRQLFSKGESSNSDDFDTMDNLLTFIESRTTPLRSPSTVTPNHLANSFSHAHHCACDGSHSNLKRRKLDEVCLTQQPHFHSQTNPNCTCSVMAEHYLQMAEAAYKNIRRKDSSPASFEQFKRELCQTNDILKESVDILTDMKKMCKHMVTDNL